MNYGFKKSLPVKIDTKGYELILFKGMDKEMFDFSKTTIICGILNSQCDKLEIFTILESYNFKIDTQIGEDYIFKKIG